VSQEFYLTPEEMVVAGAVFRDSVEHVLSNYPPEGQQGLRRFLVEWVMKYRPYMAVTAEGMPEVMRTVWGDEGRRDFFLMLSFTFFGRWGQPEVKVKGLAATLARGVAMVDRSSRDNAVPHAAGDRLADISAASQTIAANKWLMVALMIPLYCTVQDQTSKPK
jgi:hypothetical protein